MVPSVHRYGMSSVPDPHIDVLSADQCWELLRTQVVGRLGIAIMNHPDIFPINYVIDHGSIVFRTDEGTKLAASLLGTAVAFEADHYDPSAGVAWSVVAKGEAVEIDGLFELFDAADLPLFPWQIAPKHRFVRIVPEELTGRRFHVNPQALAAQAAFEADRDSHGGRPKS
jgi:nitroimidazol reductase NimA-like FMN-containing flavoprotein (pyridoxamine 5'-phosphate oxidase superfamily)